MKIAQIAPLYESVPPKRYGGTERVVSYLTEELVRQGHEVTLFASGDSVTDANLEAIVPQAIRLDNETRVPLLAHHTRMLGKVSRMAAEFDVIHNHIDVMAYPWLRTLKTPHLTTLHGRLDFPALVSLYREFSDISLVSISNSQRDPVPFANWQTTIYHGLPQNFYTFRAKPGSYLAFLGRISPGKRVDRAIEIATKVGMELRIAAKVDDQDREYYEDEIKPLLQDPLIKFIGEIDEREKNEFLGNAYALLFPIDWPEPFGLVMAEAMACGTPVIAYRHGSVPEVLQDGQTGFIVDNMSEAVAAVPKITTLNRHDCRHEFEQRFSVCCMTDNYLTTYQTMVDNHSKALRLGSDSFRRTTHSQSSVQVSAA